MECTIKYSSCRVSVWNSSVSMSPMIVRTPARPQNSTTSELHHGAQHLATPHLREGLLHIIDADALRDERAEVEPALKVERDQHREVTGRQAVSVPGRLERPTA